MDHGTYRYSIDATVSPQDVEESLLLAVLAAECLHGRARVQLDGAFRLDKTSGICVVDASTEVGRDIARVFTGFLSREFGEHAFKVERVDDGSAVASERSTTGTG